MVYHHKFTAGFTTAFTIKNGGKKVMVTMVNGKLLPFHGNPYLKEIIRVT